MDNKFDIIYFKEEIIKQSENLPNKIKISLERGKLIENEWNNNDRLYFLINDCINIEKNINHIIEIKNKIEKCDSEESKIFFLPEK